MTKQQKTTAIIAAAGESRRMEGMDKIFTVLGTEPVLVHAVSAFEKCSQVGQIVIIVSEPNVERAKKLVDEHRWAKVSAVCAGGERRQDSVAAGLAQIGDCDWVVIHDGARPLVTADLIERGLEAAKETGAAVAAVPVTDTIKLAGDDMVVMGTPPRQNLWVVQTPQVFRADIIKEAYRQVEGEVTDDAALVERAGDKVKLYMGAYDNIKITTPHDLVLAEILAQE